ncbi:putative non-specific serine/threonine protein kinase [Helianthus anomalus]
MLKRISTQGEKEFKNEIELLVLAKLNHCNLVRGYSIEGIERLLIYELLLHGSLYVVKDARRRRGASASPRA